MWYTVIMKYRHCREAYPTLAQYGFLYALSYGVFRSSIIDALSLFIQCGLFEKTNILEGDWTVYVGNYFSGENVNEHVYHYAGNNPVKYTDPDGEVIWIPILIGAIAASVLLQSDKAPNRPPPMSVGRSLGVDDKLNNTRYADGRSNQPELRATGTRDQIGSIKLDSNPRARLAASMPRGGLSPNDYDDGRTSARGTVVGAISLGGSTLANYISQSESGGHYADATLHYSKNTDGKLLDWNIKVTGIDQMGTGPMDRILDKSEAMNYLHENRGRLIDSGKYNEIEDLFN